MKPSNPLRLWRKAHSLSACDVALSLGVSEQTVLAYEKGGFQPSEKSFAKISKLVESPVELVKQAWVSWRSENAQA